MPSLLLSLLKSNSVNFGDLQSVRKIWLAAAPILEEECSKLKKKFLQPVQIYRALGLTETTYITAVGEIVPGKPRRIGKIVETMQCKVRFVL